jgi:hypothetical protein
MGWWGPLQLFFMAVAVDGGQADDVVNYHMP